jgi:hypothetical protein
MRRDGLEELEEALGLEATFGAFNLLACSH